MSAPTTPGLYWARLLHSEDSWTVVELHESPAKIDAKTGLAWADSLGWDAGALVQEWGPRLKYHGPSLLTQDEAYEIERTIFCAEGESKIKESERVALCAAVDRVTAP